MRYSTKPLKPRGGQELRGSAARHTEEMKPIADAFTAVSPLYY